MLLDSTGYDPVTYMSILSTLEKDQMLGKIVILDAAQDTLEANGEQSKISPYVLPRLSVESLFLPEKLSRTPKKLAPLSTGGPFSSVTSNGGLISPQSPARSHGRPIDLSLVCHSSTCSRFYAHQFKRPATPQTSVPFNWFCFLLNTIF